MRPVRNVLVASVLLLIASAAFARDPLTVGSATAAPGQRASGWIDVPRAGDDGTRIPVTVLHGAKDGPVLALIAGTHGYEYAPIIALQRVAASVDPGAMSGSVILVHMANPATFYRRGIYYGPDGKNLNRMYPGDAKGTHSERVAHAITTSVIDAATHVIDMHCGDGNESLRPYSYWMPIGDEKVDPASREMVLAFGLDHIVVDRSRPTDPKKTLYTSTTAMVRGRPAITTESGAMGLTDEASVAANVAGALSVMNHLGIVSAPSITVKNPIWFEKTEVVRAPVAGVWRPVVDRMHSVAAGALLGRIVDPFGAVLREIRAPFAGEVLYVVGTPPVSEGEPLGMIAAVAADPAEDPPYEPASRDYGLLHRVWEHPSFVEPADPKFKLVAADITFPPTGEKFDLDDVDIFDAATGKNHGSGPMIYRLTMDGRFADESKTAWNDADGYRGVFLWTVPASVRTVNFGYWGDMLFIKPRVVQASGPQVPEALRTQ